MGPVIVIIQYLNLFDLLTFSINMDRSAQDFFSLGDWWRGAHVPCQGDGG